MESNITLRQLSIQANLPGAIAATAVSRRTWYPPVMNPAMQSISDKNVADVVEAIIGAAYFDGGEPGAGKVLNIIFGEEVKQDAREYLPLIDESRAWKSSVQSQEMENSALIAANTIYQKVGYRFKNPYLALESLTHSSAIGLDHNYNTCYQRLEFLGIYNIVSIEWCDSI
jgi:dsRNA-specific ribonuclease